VEIDLKKHMPSYSKVGDRKTFSQLIDNIDIAILNAQRSLAVAENTDTDNPTTRVHVLVESLQKIKAMKIR